MMANLIYKKIGKLLIEQLDLILHQNYWMSLSSKYKDTFEYTWIELAIAICRLKIEVLRAVEKDLKRIKMIFQKNKNG